MRWHSICKGYCSCTGEGKQPLAIFSAAHDVLKCPPCSQQQLGPGLTMGIACTQPLCLGHSVCQAPENDPARPQLLLLPAVSPAVPSAFHLPLHRAFKASGLEQAFSFHYEISISPNAQRMNHTSVLLSAQHPCAPTAFHKTSRGPVPLPPCPPHLRITSS